MFSFASKGVLLRSSPSANSLRPACRTGSDIATQFCQPTNMLVHMLGTETNISQIKTELLERARENPAEVSARLASNLSDPLHRETAKDILLEVIPIAPRESAKNIAVAAGDTRCDPQDIKQLIECLMETDPRSTIYSFVGLFRTPELSAIAANNLPWMMAGCRHGEDIASKALVAALREYDRPEEKPIDTERIARIKSFIVEYQRSKDPGPDEIGKIAARDKKPRPDYFFESRLSFALENPRQRQYASEVLIELGDFEPYSVSRAVACRLKDPEIQAAAKTVLSAIADIDWEHERLVILHAIYSMNKTDETPKYAEIPRRDEEVKPAAQSFIESRFEKNGEKERIRIAAKLASHLKDGRLTDAVEKTLLSLAETDTFAAATGVIRSMQDNVEHKRRHEYDLTLMSSVNPHDVLRALVEYLPDKTIGKWALNLMSEITGKKPWLETYALELIRQKIESQLA